MTCKLHEQLGGVIRMDITQGTREWHEIRYGKVGGTTSDQLHVDSDTLLNELIACRLEPYRHEPSYVSEAMQRGIDLEPEARREMEAYTGEKFIVPGWIESAEVPLIGYSPDGITSSGPGRIGIEIKCPGAKKHVEYLRLGKNVVPKEYLHQCVHIFAVCPDIELVYFASYRPECMVPLYVAELTRKSQVNIGTEKRPKTTTVEELADNKIATALTLTAAVESEVEKLSF